MPTMKPGKNQGNIDKKALAKQNGDDTTAQDEFDSLWDSSGLGDLDEVLLTNKPTKTVSPQDRRYDRALDNDALNDFGDTIKIGGDNNVSVSSGGDGDPEAKKEFGDDFLYGTKRFNRLWSLYNEVKDQDGIENNPEYHRLIKKLTRKMPKTIRNIDRNVKNSMDMRNKINEKLGNAPMDLKTDEVVKNVKTRINKFIENPFYTKPPSKEDNENKNQNSNIGKEIVSQKRGSYLAPQLGNDIKKSLKNFR
jgi:hypothetical protein